MKANWINNAQISQSSNRLPKEQQRKDFNFILISNKWYTVIIINPALIKRQFISQTFSLFNKSLVGKQPFVFIMPDSFASSFFLSLLIVVLVKFYLIIAELIQPMPLLT